MQYTRYSDCSDCVRTKYNREMENDKRKSNVRTISDKVRLLLSIVGKCDCKKKKKMRNR